MVREDAHYDLCSVMLKELMTNLQKNKKDKKNTLWYGSLIICLTFYFLNMVPNYGKIQWEFDRSVATQITQILDQLGDKLQKDNLWAFFKTFQKEMKNWERIPK